MLNYASEHQSYGENKTRSMVRGVTGADIVCRTLSYGLPEKITSEAKVENKENPGSRRLSGEVLSCLASMRDDVDTREGKQR